MKRIKNFKGQTWLEYFLSITVYVLAVLYVFFQITLVLPAHANAIRTQSLNVEAYQLSEILVNDAGEPQDWDTLTNDKIIRIGLLDQTQNKTNLISLDKVTKLNGICGAQGGYEVVRSKLGLTDLSIFISFIDRQTGSVILTCSPPTATSPFILSNSTRTTAFRSQSAVGYGEFNLQVW